MKQPPPHEPAITAYLTFTGAEIAFTKNFELLVDCKLASLKGRLMRLYRQRQPKPPKWLRQALIEAENGERAG